MVVEDALCMRIRQVYEEAFLEDRRQQQRRQQCVFRIVETQNFSCSLLGVSFLVKMRLMRFTVSRAAFANVRMSYP